MLQMGALRHGSQGNTPERPPGQKSQDTERGLRGPGWRLRTSQNVRPATEGFPDPGPGRHRTHSLPKPRPASHLPRLISTLAMGEAVAGKEGRPEAGIQLLGGTATESLC